MDNNFNDLLGSVNKVLSFLSEKERDVIVQRYGLFETSHGTLASVGETYQITRERVRQIQNYALKKMIRGSVGPEFSVFFEWLNGSLERAGGIVSEADHEENLLGRYPSLSSQLAELKFISVLNGRVMWEHNKVNFRSHFRFAKYDFSLIKEICDRVNKYLSSRGQVVPTEILVDDVKSYFEDKSIDIPKKFIVGCIKLDKRLRMNSAGVSLLAWRHVNPKTLFDKILYVLLTSNEPLHFNQIAETIRMSKFDDKKVSTQAVHNELINNPLFILIGRGIYALKTWGYKEGTVSDVLESILEKRGPMSVDELTREVLQRRKVKAITIQVNLNNNKTKFRRTRLGMYELAV